MADVADNKIPYWAFDHPSRLRQMVEEPLGDTGTELTVDHLKAAIERGREPREVTAFYIVASHPRRGDCDGREVLLASLLGESGETATIYSTDGGKSWQPDFEGRCVG